jgi:hypothetical protein
LWGPAAGARIGAAAVLGQRGRFIAFEFGDDATKEIKRANREEGLDIVVITVKELLEHERVAV